MKYTYAIVVFASFWWGCDKKSKTPKANDASAQRTTTPYPVVDTQVQPDGVSNNLVSSTEDRTKAPNKRGFARAGETPQTTRTVDRVKPSHAPQAKAVRPHGDASKPDELGDTLDSETE